MRQVRSGSGFSEPATMVTSARLGPGVEIGHFKIIRKLGEGGMGVVYEATQTKPTRRVALKVIHSGVASEKMLKRFEIEVEMLGRLRHPGIAQIFEAGMFYTAVGAQPFFAMECVDGERLNTYIKSKNPTMRERIDLLVKICQAVHHAHQKGVIHRDLKPANILVDPEGQPKILDFGVARATDSDLRSATLQTDIGQLLGTVPYMSPEQASGMPDELDTRSDVYAMGVVCYEVLSGQMPYDIKKQMIHEAVRVIREQDPDPLSSYGLHLRGDVETIINKALEKDKTRRYQSCNELAADFQRFLNFEPIQAHPPSVWYQLSKFSRRNRTLVSGVSGVAASLVIGLVVSTYLYVEADRARVAESIARQEAETAAQINQQVNRFLVDDVLQAAQPERTLGRVVTVREILAQASQGIDEGGLKDQPLVEAAVHEAIGNSYRALGEYGPAKWHLQQAADLRIEHLGMADDLSLASSNDLAAVLWYRGEYEQAHAIWKGIYDQRVKSVGPNHPATLAVRLNLALLQIDRSAENEIGEKVYQELIEVATQSTHVLGPTHPLTMIALKHLAQIHLQRGEADAAGNILEDILARQVASKSSNHHPDVLLSAYQLAELRHRQGHLTETEPLLLAIYNAMAKVLGDDHPDTIAARAAIGRLFLDQGKIDAAYDIFTDVLARCEQVFPKGHRQTLAAQSDLAAVHFQAGRYKQAEELWQSVLEKRRADLGENSQPTFSAMVDLASVYRATGKYKDAEQLLQKALEGQRKVLGESHPDTLATRSNLSSLLWVTGDYEQAKTHAEIAVEQFRLIYGPSHPNTLYAINNLALIYMAQSEYAAAANAWQVAIPFADANLGETHFLTLLLRNNFAWLLREVDQPAQAVAICGPIYQQYVKQFGPNHLRTLAVQSNLAMALLATGKVEQARQHMTHVLSQRRAQLGNDHVDTATAAYRLARVLRTIGGKDQARALLTEAIMTRNRLLGHDHPDTLRAMNQMVQLSIDVGDLQTADTMSKRLVQRAKERFPETHRQLADHLYVRALVLKATDRDDDARPLLSQAQAIFSQRLGQNHFQTNRVSALLGR